MKKQTVIDIHIDDILLSLENVFYDMIDESDKENQDKLCYEFMKLIRLIKVYKLMSDYELESFNWKPLIENGEFCKMDFKMFSSTLLKDGYESYEQACKIYEENLKNKKVQT